MARSGVVAPLRLRVFALDENAISRHLERNSDFSLPNAEFCKRLSRFVNSVTAIASTRQNVVDLYEAVMFASL